MASDKSGLLIGCASVGIGAASLWSAHGTYLTSAGVALSTASGMPLTKAASVVNSTFFRTQFTSGGVSCLLTSVLFLLMNPADVLTGLFLLLTLVGFAGFLVLSALLPADSESDAVFAMPLASLLHAAQTGYGYVVHRDDARLVGSVGTQSMPQSDGSASGPAKENGQSAPPTSDHLETATKLHADAGKVNAMKRSLPVFVSQRGFLPVESFGFAHRSVTVPAVADTSVPREPRPALESPPNRPPTLLVLVQFMFADQRMLLLAPSITAIGAVMGLFNTLFFSAVVARGPGLAYLGFVGAVQSFAGSGAIAVWGCLVNKPTVGRRAALATAVALQLAFLLSAVCWVTYVRTLQSSPEPAEPPLLLGVAYVILAAVVYGSTEGIFMTYIPATLQTYFGKGPFASCGNAAFRLYSALGFAVQASVSAGLGGEYVAEQHAALFGLCALSHMSLLWLHLRVCSVDGVKEEPKEDALAPSDVCRSSSISLQPEQLEAPLAAASAVRPSDPAAPEKCPAVIDAPFSTRASVDDEGVSSLLESRGSELQLELALTGTLVPPSP
jgi:hypothetical protein